MKSPIPKEQGHYDQIIEAIDDYLIKSRKTHITLAQANKLLTQNNLISVTDRHSGKLKRILEEGFIPHAFQTQTIPKQWRIPLSDHGQQRPKALLQHLTKEQSKVQHKESIREWYQSFDEREKKGFKRLVLIVASILIIVFVNVIPDNRSNLVKSLDKQYIGREWTDFTYQNFNQLYGPGQPLRYEDSRWVYYYPRGNFTIKIAKKNNQISEISGGKD